MAVDGDLGPSTHLTGDLADLHDPLGDLGHLEVEQRRDEQGVGPGEDEPGPLRRLVHLLEHGADGVPLAESLPGILILPRDDGVGVPGPVQEDDHLAALHLLDLTREKIPDLVVELVPDPLPLAFTDPLHDPLLHGHDRVPPELGEVHGNLHDVADLVRVVVPAGILQRDLRGLVLDVLDHTLQHDDVELTRDVVDLDLGLDVRAIETHEGRDDPILHEIVDFVRRQVLRRPDIPQRSHDLPGVRHHSSSRVQSRINPTDRRCGLRRSPAEAPPPRPRSRVGDAPSPPPRPPKRPGGFLPAGKPARPGSLPSDP